jgi:outer membrane protein OmpA-like peptidoglycan-associated protein
MQRWLIITSKALCAAAILCCTASILQAQETDVPTLNSGYYVVVAAYRPTKADLAQKFSQAASEKGVTTSLGMDARRRYCYVYVNRHDNLSASLEEMRKVRRGEFSDAWVRVMTGDGTAEPMIKSTPAVVAKPEPKREPDATVYVAIPKAVVEEQAQPEPPKEQTPAAAVVASVEPAQPANVVTEVIENPPADPIIGPQTLSNTPIFLSLFNARNNRIVNGDIEVIDTERSRSLTKVKGNSYLTLPDPKSKSGELTLACTAFGYRKVQHIIHYKNTEADTAQPHVDLVGNFYLVKFDLVRLQKGDISVLYNVYFYNDAAIMLPESKYELNNLLDMMKDNPNYRIVLHGHTNSNASGPLITMGPSKEYFALAPDIKRGIGSAKDLSRERGEAIKSWLVDNGVAADRIEVKAWGGARMLHDKHSAHAKKNVRVEVEVLED